MSNFKAVPPGSKLVWGKNSGGGGGKSPSGGAEKAQALIGETKYDDMSPRNAGVSITLGRKHVRLFRGERETEKYKAEQQ